MDGSEDQKQFDDTQHFQFNRYGIEKAFTNKDTAGSGKLPIEIKAIGGQLIIRSLATETVSVSETLARTKFSFRTLTAETVSISETLSRLKTSFKSLATEVVAISESLARRKTSIRTVPTETVPVGESLTRLKSVFRSLVTETVPVSESLNKVKIAIRSLSLESVGISENLSRFKQAFRSLATEVVPILEDLQVAVLRPFGMGGPDYRPWFYQPSSTRKKILRLANVAISKIRVKNTNVGSSKLKRRENIKTISKIRKKKV